MNRMMVFQPGRRSTTRRQCDGRSPCEPRLLGDFLLDTVTAVDDQSSPPQATTITTIYPNPFNPRTTIEFGLAEVGQVELAIFDMRGRLVQVVDSGSRSVGRHQATWDGRDDEGRAVPTGTYICRLSTPQGSQTKKMTVAR